MDGVLAGTGGTNSNTSDKGFKLFALDFSKGSIAKAICRISSFRMYDGSVLVMDMIPVRIGTVGYMYDMVSRTLFSNIGSGSFTLGPDV